MSTEEGQTSLNSLNESVAELGISMETLQAIAESMGKAMGSMQPTAKEMNKSQFFKSAKSMGGMFKSMMGASPKTAVISSFISKISDIASPLGDLFSPLETGLDIAKGAVETFVASALKPMYDAMQPLYNTLLDTLGPASDLGTAFGEALAPALESVAEPLGTLIADIGTTFANVLIDIAPTIGDVIVAIVDFIGTLMDAFLPIIEEIVPFMVDQLGAQFISMLDIFEQLMPVIGPLIELFVNLLAMGMTPLTIALQFLSYILEPLAPYIEKAGTAISMVTKGIQGVFNFFIKGINKVMNFITAGLWKDIPLLGEEQKKVEASIAREGLDPGEYHAQMEGLDFSNIDYSKINIPSAQHGGITLSEGIVNLHAGEAIMPLDQFTAQQTDQKNLLSMMLSELLRLNEQQFKLNRMKEDKYVFERMK